MRHSPPYPRRFLCNSVYLLKCHGLTGGDGEDESGGGGLGGGVGGPRTNDVREERIVKIRRNAG